MAAARDHRAARIANSSSRNAVNFSSARTAFRRRDVRQQPRSFARENPRLTRRPNANRVGVDRAAEATLGAAARGLVVGDEAVVASTITVVSDGESDKVRLPSVVVAKPNVSNAVHEKDRVANVGARRPRGQVGHSAVLTVLRERFRRRFADALASAGKKPSDQVLVRSREVNSLCTIVDDADARVRAIVDDADARVGAYGRQRQNKYRENYCLFHINVSFTWWFFCDWRSERGVEAPE